MRVQIFSDVHCNVYQPKPIVIGRDVDLVAVAGDVAEGVKNSFITLRTIVPMTIPIVFTMGNHEFYRRFWREELEVAKSIGPDFNITTLENDVVLLDNGNVRVIGATTWTDYRLFGEQNVAAAMKAARDGLNDHRLIGWQKTPWQRFRPQEALLLHSQSREFIADVLATPFSGATLTLTHHAPHYDSVPVQYQNEILTAAYASDLGSLMGACVVDGQGAEAPCSNTWIHGHIHSSVDYQVGATRILSNPHGYGDENRSFNPTLIIEV